jgi:hypothetical protein
MCQNVHLLELKKGGFWTKLVILISLTGHLPLKMDYS